MDHEPSSGIFLYLIILLGAVLLALMTIMPNHRRNNALRDRSAQLRADIARLDADQRAIEQRLIAIETDPAYVERLLRRERVFLQPVESWEELVSGVR